MQDEGFCAALEKADLNTVVVCGIEAHVCVNQTVLDLMQAGKQVHVITDAIGSRHLPDCETAVKKMLQAGAIPSTTEMALFELTDTAGTPEFKNVQRMVKSKLKLSIHAPAPDTLMPRAAQNAPAKTVYAAPNAHVHEVPEAGIDESPVMFEEKSKQTIAEQKAVVDDTRKKPAPAVIHIPGPPVPDSDTVTVIKPGQTVSVPTPEEMPETGNEHEDILGMSVDIEEISDKPQQAESGKPDAGIKDDAADAGDILGSAAGESPEAEEVELDSIIAAEKKQGNQKATDTDAPEKQKAITDDTDVFDAVSIEDIIKQEQKKRT